MEGIVDVFIKWLVIFIALIVVIGIPVYLIYIFFQYTNKYIKRNNNLETRIKELEKRVKELEMKHK